MFAAPALILIGLLSLLSACGDGSSAPTLTAIAVGPPTASAAAGLSQSFTATGIYSDGSKHDISTAVTWSSSNPTVATISTPAGSAGLATLVQPGTTEIIATINGMSGAAVLTVTPAVLVSIGVTPMGMSVASGMTQGYKATGVYSDHSVHDLTATVAWSSSAPAIATIANTTGSKGLATAAVPGSTTITASLGNVSGSTSLTVTGATLVSIGVTPANLTLPQGLRQSFNATGVYSDGSTHDLTASVIWGSSSPSVATVSNATGSTGSVAAVTAGSTKITAMVGSVTGLTNLTVSPASLVSIAVTPPTPIIAKGLSPQFTATGTYTDNSTHNLTTQVTWSSSNTSVATVSNASGFDGLGTALGIGNATITAALGAVSGSTVVTVTAATLVSIGVTPASAILAKGTSTSFTATGVYTDNSTQNLTSSVTWTSSDTTIATISNAQGSNGLALALATGSVTVTASLSSVSGATSLTVTPATLVSISITPTGPSIPYAGSEQFIATGTYSDNSTQILTTSVTWASSMDSIASISNAASSNGLASGIAVGSSLISAGLGSINSPAVTLTVTQHQESVLYSFEGATDGANSYAALIQGTDGNFYGTTAYGGTSNNGTVFKVTPSGAETVLYTFTGGTDGAQPFSGLIEGADGNFYGTTQSGGTAGHGTVFMITPAGAETVLYSFMGGADGLAPSAALIQGSDGNFYGSTAGGGAGSGGTVFKITAAGVKTILYSFSGTTDGRGPEAPLIQASDGNFYGTTLETGSGGAGTVFKITPAGTETVLYTFTGGSDGQYPYAALIQGTDGNFYGTTREGGINAYGTVFKVTPAGVETVLYRFTNGSDGSSPFATLILGADGKFYGTTSQGGTYGNGTIFDITPDGVLTVLYSFGSISDGADPFAGLIQGVDGNFYGTTQNGGSHVDGTVFKF